MTTINDAQRAALQAACDDVSREVLTYAGEAAQAEALAADWRARQAEAQSRCDALLAGIADDAVAPDVTPAPDDTTTAVVGVVTGAVEGSGGLL